MPHEPGHLSDPLAPHRQPGAFPASGTRAQQIAWFEAEMARLASQGSPTAAADAAPYATIIAQLRQLEKDGQSGATIETFTDKSGRVYHWDAATQTYVDKTPRGATLNAAPAPPRVHVTGKGVMEIKTDANGNSVATLIPGTEDSATAAKQITHTDPTTGDVYHYDPEAVDAEGNKGVYIKKLSGSRQQDAPITQADRDAGRGLTTAQTDRVKAETGAIETPDQRQKREIATAIANQKAQADAAWDLIEKKRAAGLEITPAEQAALQTTLQTTLATLQGEVARINAKYTHDLGQPDRDRTFGLQEEQQRSLDQSRRDTAEYQRGQLDVTREAEGRQQAVERAKPALAFSQEADKQAFEMAKAGVAPVANYEKLVFEPLSYARQVLDGMVKKGQVPASMVPPTQAPTPAGAAPPPGTAAPAPAAASVQAPRPGGV